MSPEKIIKLQAKQRCSSMNIIIIHRINEGIYNPITSLEHRNDNEIGKKKCTIGSHQCDPRKIKMLDP
jgi:hypothetical protein